MLWNPETLCPVHFSNYSKRYMHLNFIFQRNKRKWCDSFVAEYIYFFILLFSYLFIYLFIYLHVSIYLSIHLFIDLFIN